jgi:hypothetical protein
MTIARDTRHSLIHEQKPARVSLDLQTYFSIVLVSVSTL